MHNPPTHVNVQELEETKKKDVWTVHHATYEYWFNLAWMDEFVSTTSIQGGTIVLSTSDED